MTTWREWMKRKLGGQAEKAAQRIEPTVEMPQERNVIDTQPTSSRVLHLHPDETYWPSEEASGRMEDEKSLPDEGIPTPPTSFLHPDDAYWPSDRADIDPLRGDTALERHDGHLADDPPETTPFPPDDLDILEDEEDAVLPPKTLDNEPPLDDTALATSDAHLADDPSDTPLPSLDDFEAFEDEESDFDFLPSLPDSVSDSPPENEDASFVGLEELDLEAPETTETYENDPEDTLNWAYDLDDDWHEADPSSPFADDEDEIPAWRITERAALLVDLLSPDTTKQRDMAFGILCDLLEEFPHGSSIKAIARQITAGATLDDLLRCANLKRLWKEDEGLWLRRDYRKGTRTCSTQRNALTWGIAGRLVGEYVPGTLEAALLGDWRQTWIDMDSPEAGEPALASWFSYAAFLAEHPSDWTTDMTTLLGTGLETGWVYTALPSRSDFRERTHHHPHIAMAASETLSRVAKPTFYEER